MSNPEPVQPVQPMPMPVSYGVTRVVAPDGVIFVVLELQTVTGTTVAFLPDDFARGLANALMSASTGLVLPGLAVPA